ncbi:TPA_asm: hypothetical protein vir530_00019 [dsDNA virus vir530]|nr:TPA_asm: hypothetical protein vir530_00019 [dsDNA virus vir530]
MSYTPTQIRNVFLEIRGHLQDLNIGKALFETDRAINGLEKYGVVTHEIADPQEKATEEE